MISVLNYKVYKLGAKIMSLLIKVIAALILLNKTGSPTECAAFRMSLSNSIRF